MSSTIEGRVVPDGSMTVVFGQQSKVSTCRDDVNANKGDQSLVRKPIFDRFTVDKCLKIVYVVHVGTIIVIRKIRMTCNI